MTRLDALKALAEKVEAGEWDFAHNAPARVVFPYQSASVDDLGLTARAAFEGSLDAAQALHKAVLPGVPWWVEIRTDDQAEAGIFLRDAGRIITARHDETSPARAWLLAILRALIAQEEGK